MSSRLGFKALSKDRKPAGNAFQNPLETQFQVVSRGLKLFENALEILWKLFTNPLEALQKPGLGILRLFGNSLETILRPFGNQVSGV